MAKLNSSNVFGDLGVSGNTTSKSMNIIDATVGIFLTSPSQSFDYKIDLGNDYLNLVGQNGYGIRMNENGRLGLGPNQSPNPLTADVVCTELHSFDGISADGVFSGNGSGLLNVNADTIDSLDSTSFLRSNTNDIFSGGYIRFNDNSEARFGSGSDLRIDHDGTNNWFRSYNDGADTIFQVQDGVGTSRYFHMRNDGDFEIDGIYSGNGSGLTNVDAATVDGLNGSAFIRSNSNDNVTADTEWQDNYEIRLGSSADFRMWFNGSHTYFRSYHDGGNIYFRGDDSNGTYAPLLYMVNATTAPYLRLFRKGVERLRTTSAGVTVYDDVTANSDRRLKENIETLTDTLDGIGQIRGVRYNRIDGDDREKVRIGVIAQEVEKVFPELVYEQEHGDDFDEEVYKEVNYMKLSAVLVQGINEQQKTINSLQEQINELKEIVGNGKSE